MTWDEKEKTLKVTLFEDRAEDVAHTFQLVQKLQVREFVEGFKNLEKLEKISPREVHFRLRKYDRLFSFLLTRLPIVAADPERATGDFTIDREAADEVVLRRKKISPNLVNRIVVRQILSPRRVIRELVAGHVDLSFMADIRNPDVLKDLEELEFGVLKSRRIYLVLDNWKRNRKNPIPWKLLSQKIDRSSIVSQLSSVDLETADLPASKEDYWAGALPESIPANGAARAHSSLKMSEDYELSFLAIQDLDFRLAFLLKRHLEEMGIRLKLDSLSPQQMVQKVLSSATYDLVLLSLLFQDTMISNYFIFHTPSGSESANLSSYSNPKVDYHLEEARYSVRDGEAKAAFAKAMRLMHEDPPGLFLFWLNSPIVYRKSCSGFKLNTVEFYSSLKDVRCEPSAVN
jgi:ABC-type oligopeptide transport system substrate-binding subunit